MAVPPNLDQVLKEIQATNSAGVTDIDTHLASRPDASPAIYTPTEVSPGRQGENIADTAHILSSGLSERQRRLPKIDFRMVGGVLAVLLLIVGVGTATVLTGQSQELRQRAFQAVPTATPIPQFAGTPTPTPASVEQPVQQPALSPTLTLILGAVGLVVIIGLVAVLFWAFVV